MARDLTFNQLRTMPLDDFIDLLLQEHYTIDEQTGVISNRRTGKPLKACANSAGVLTVRLCAHGVPRTVELRRVLAISQQGVESLRGRWVRMHRLLPYVLYTPRHHAQGEG